MKRALEHKTGSPGSRLGLRVGSSLSVVLGLATVLAANFLYLAGLPAILDPMLSMDPFYIGMAAQPLAGILHVDPAWGPLYAVWLAALWLAWTEARTAGGRVLAWPVCGLAGFLILALGLGTPLFGAHQTGDRLLAAFREHFAWNWSRWHGQGQDFQSIWEQEFGDAQTTGQAFLNNPAAGLHHLANNFDGSVWFLTATAFDHYPVLVPATAARLVRAENLFVSAVVFGSLIVVFVRAALRRRLLAAHGDTLYVWAILATASLASATMIYPSAHYLVIPAVLLLLAGVLAISEIVPAGAPLSWRLAAAGSVVCLAAVPRPFVLPSTYVVPGAPFKGHVIVERLLVDSIALVRSLNLPVPLQVLTLQDGIGEMLGAGFREVKVWQKGDQSLEAYVQANDVRVIITLEAGRDSFLFSDPYWTTIRIDPAAAGFTRVPVPNHATVGVYVRSELLPTPVPDGRSLHSLDGPDRSG